MSRRNFFWLFTLILVFVIQISAAGSLSVFGVVPNFFLLATIFFGIRGGPITGELLGFTWGILSDVISMTLFGSQAFMMTLVGYVAGRLERKVDEEKYSAQMILVLFMSIMYIAGIFFLESLFGETAERLKNKTAVLAPIYYTILSPIFFWALVRWTIFFGRSDLKAKLS